MKHPRPLAASRLLPCLLLAAALAASGCGDDGSAGGGGSTGSNAACGNGVVEAGEACDAGDLDGESCVGLGFSGGALACSDTCEVDTSGCSEEAACGNGQLETGEACDGSALGESTCESAGFVSGELGCTESCELDTSLCESPVEIECGNDLLETGETCDGLDLAGETCATLGFASGTLVCDAACELDTTGCTTCGDDLLDAGEECDGARLDRQSCLTLGFDSGDLACASDCSFDDSDCNFVNCGNGAIDGAEECDGATLAGGTCVSEGFSDGQLSCEANCTYDTSACTTCGDGITEGNEACDGLDLASEDCGTLGFASGSLACNGSCGFDISSCSNLPAPGDGELVITEIMQNPSGADGTAGEWFELTNPSATITYQLGGCTIEGDTPAESVAITGNLQIAPLQRLTLSSIAAPGFTPSYVYGGGFVLTNTDDAVRLLCAGDVVDEVFYDGGPEFPNPDGESMSLEPGSDTIGNDDGASWCQASVISANFTSGDKGTPGSANPACGSDVSIGFCRLQFPTSITAIEGTSVTVYGRVYAQGLTDLTTGNDPAPNLLAAVGRGPDGSDPALGGWTWTAATPNAGWDGNAFGEPNNDEYQASLLIPAAAGSPRDYAYRFSGDGGTSWTYCDGDSAGSSNGYAPTNAGQLTSTPVPLWINEIHYDNASTDANEGVEVAGAAGLNLSGYSLIFYNGSDGASYDSEALTGTIPNQANGFGTVWFPVAGMQNGAPEGIALLGPGGVLMFIGYEGTFAATNGAALGQTCVAMPVSEEPAPAVGMSLQLTGTGGVYSAFTWSGPVAHSRGAINAGQTLQ